MGAKILKNFTTFQKPSENESLLKVLVEFKQKKSANSSDSSISLSKARNEIKKLFFPVQNNEFPKFTDDRSWIHDCSGCALE